MVKKVKTATVTWITYHNFGTYLQAYALQKTIRYLGFENRIISDKRFIESKEESNSFRKFIVKVYHCLGGNYRMVKGRKKENKSYENFLNKYLLVDDDWTDLPDLDDKYDIFVCGSDQIWTSYIDNIEEFYYLGFTSKKKIAYAPSIGQNFYTKKYEKQVKPLLEQFAHLSVREKTGRDLLSEFIDKPIKVVIDPTLLLPSSEWLALTNVSTDSTMVINSYILCYFLTYNDLYIDSVIKFAKRVKLPVKIFITDKRFLSYADEPLFVGPIDFLKEIKNSTYFFTDSFHGSIFAIIFEKRFLTFKRFNDKEKNNQNSRIEDLFSILGLSDYFVDNLYVGNEINLFPTDYSFARKMIQLERMHSMSYLAHSLEY